MKKFANYFYSTMLALYFSFAGYMIYELAVHIIPKEHGWMSAICAIAFITHLGLYALIVWALGNIFEEMDKRNNGRHKPA